MDELKNILRHHAGRYPQMQPADGVKLIYQNEFGGGHLIRDEEACLFRLRQEYAATEKRRDVPLYEPIGNGILRVNLAAVPADFLEELGQLFLRGAAEHKGSPDRFRRKLEVLRPLTREGVFSFGPEALEGYLSQYEKAGFPMVSHSRQYREAYRPAYRVIPEIYCKK